MTTAVAAETQKWEYCLLTRKTEVPLLAEINMLGQEGWEVITILYYKDLKNVMSWTAFLKRPCVAGAHARPAPAGPAVVQPSASSGKPAAAPAGDSLKGFDMDADFEFKEEE